MRMEKATEIVLAQELFEQGLSKSAIARRVGRDRETIRLWLRGIEQHGQKAFLDKNAAACKVPRPARQVDAVVKRWIWQIREREEQCCGQKIAYFLEKEQSIHVSVPKIYEVLAEKYVLRSKWKKNKVRGEVPQALASRQVVEMDTVDFGGLFAFTAVDIFSREADVLLRPALTAEHGAAFLHRCMRRRFNRGCPLGGCKWCRLMAEVSSRPNLHEKCGATANSTALLVLTRRTSRLILRVSTALCARSVWAGANTRQRMQATCWCVWRSFSNATIIIGHTWLSSP